MDIERLKNIRQELKQLDAECINEWDNYVLQFMDFYNEMVRDYSMLRKLSPLD